MITIPELLRDHVSLDAECVDRVYLNGYIPMLQSSGGLVYFLEHHRGQLIASPALLGEITQNFAAGVAAFAKQEGIPNFKENRALCTETTANNPHDFGVDKGLRNWVYLRQLGTAINRRLLETERVSQDCLLSAESFARVSEPTMTETGQRAPGLRFGQPRVMALFAALSRCAPGLNGFRHADVREIVPSLLGIAPEAYTSSQMSYDLRRLRLKGLIARIAGKHTYILTTYGRKVVYLMTKLQHRIFDIASAALDTAIAVPSQLAHAFHQLDDELDKLVANAPLAPLKS